MNSSFARRSPGAASLLRTWLPCILIAGGILLRLVLFFQNRNLIIDEANIARNLGERGYLALLQPLSYQQFAPPGFLWAEKLAVSLLGYGEKALRLYPLLSGIASLFVFEKVLRHLLPASARWFPLAVLCLGSIYVEYSTVAKPYASDVLVCLLLLHATLVLFRSATKTRPLLRLMAGGAVAIWFSMPAVFVLAGVGAAVLLHLLQAKAYRPVLLLACAGLTWILSFAAYYGLLLRHQVGNEVLQQFHEPYFLFLLPKNIPEWSHNGERLLALFGVAAGYTGIAMACSLLFFAAGCVALVRSRYWAVFVLLLLPVLLLLLAAGLHRFTLIERVVLFALPLLLTVMGYGLDLLLRLLQKMWWKGLWQALAAAAIATYAMFGILWKKYGFYELTEGLMQVQSQKAEHYRLCLHHGITDAFVYYTCLHPDREQWKALQPHAVLLQWDDDYSAVVPVSRDTVYFLYTGIAPEELEQRHRQWATHRQQVAFFERYQCRVETWTPAP